jgi:ribose 1,5-bisphosphokinase PhnN
VSRALLRRYRRGWRKTQLIALQRWKQVWQRRMAARERWHANVQRMRERIQRRMAWQAWQDWQRHAQRTGAAAPAGQAAVQLPGQQASAAAPAPAGQQ